jgi:hypothetical protein
MGLNEWRKTHFIFLRYVSVKIYLLQTKYLLYIDNALH